MHIVAPSVLLLVAALAGAVGGFALTHSDIYMVSPRTTFVHVYLPMAVAALCLAVLPFRQTRGVAAAMVVAAGFGILAAEIVLGVRGGPAGVTARNAVVAAAATKAGRAVDPRPHWQVVADLRAAGQDAYPTFSPTEFLLSRSDLPGRLPLTLGNKDVFPLTNIAGTNSVYCNESGQWLVFPSDRFGFNNPNEVWDGRPIEVALVGDSFAQGACVQPEQSVAALLRAQGLDAVTIGVGGTGSLIQLALAKEYLTAHRPKTVFWFFYDGNDVHTNLPLESASLLLRRYLIPGFRLDLPTETGRIDAFLRDAVDSTMPGTTEGGPSRTTFSLSKASRLLTLRERLGLVQCPRRDQDFALLASIAAEFRRTVSEWGGTLVTVYLPTSAIADCDLFGIPDRERNWLYDAALTVFETAQVAIIDLRAEYHARGTPADFHFYPGSHFAPAGYRFVAAALSDWIARNPADSSARAGQSGLTRP